MLLNQNDWTIKKYTSLKLYIDEHLIDFSPFSFVTLIFYSYFKQMET